MTVPTEGGATFFPRTATFVVTNVFDTGFYEFDARWIFIDLREAERLMNAAGAANLVEVKLKPGEIIEVDFLRDGSALPMNPPARDNQP